MEDAKKSLPIWFWPIIGTFVAMLVLVMILGCYFKKKSDVNMASEKTADESTYKDKGCCTRFMDSFRKQPENPGPVIVEMTPAKDSMVKIDEENSASKVET